NLAQDLWLEPEFSFVLVYILAAARKLVMVHACHPRCAHMATPTHGNTDHASRGMRSHQIEPIRDEANEFNSR
ncbi:MAG: hypothetical protein AAF664_16910, partial [Planctomycetota bacterium]